MTAAEAFAAYDAHAIAPDARGAAEYRHLVARILTRDAPDVRRWSDVLALYHRRSHQADAMGHVCGTPDCEAQSLSVGAQFSDPANAGAPRQRASGVVWVCRVSLLRHDCNQIDRCAYTVYRMRGEGACRMTGLAKPAPIVSVMADVQADVYNTIVASMLHDGGSAKHTTADRRRPPPRRPVRRARASLQADALLSLPLLSATTNQISAICAALLVGEACIARECLRSLDAAVGALRAADTCVATCAALYDTAGPALLAVMRLAPALYCRIDDADVAYLVASVARVLNIALLTPKMAARDNAPSAKGIRPVDAVVPILAALRDGLVAVEYTSDAGDDVELMTHAQADSFELCHRGPVRRTTFVTAHPHLAHVLVDALPRDGALSGYFAHSMATRGVIRAAFASVINRGADAHLYCLSTYVPPRPGALANIGAAAAAWRARWHKAESWRGGNFSSAPAATSC